MGDHVHSELKGKAKEIIHSQGDNLAQLVKRQCEAEVDFLELLKTAFSEEEAQAIKKAYSECKPAGHWSVLEYQWYTRWTSRKPKATTFLGC